ncbi:hypothetical protein [Pantoea agglomerans]|nr:hypothetical protein [Pantoea agglomerans]
MNKPAWLISLMPPLMSVVIIRTYPGAFDNASRFQAFLISFSSL